MEIKWLTENGQVKETMKRRIRALKTRPSKITPEELAQGSLKRVHCNTVEFFLVKLA